MDDWKDEWMNGMDGMDDMDGRMDGMGWMDGWKNGMHACMYGMNAGMPSTV